MKTCVALKSRLNYFGFVLNEDSDQPGNLPSLASQGAQWVAKSSLVVRKPVFGFQTRSDTNRAVQPQKMARDLKFRI